MLYLTTCTINELIRYLRRGKNYLQLLQDRGRSYKCSNLQLLPVCSKLTAQAAEEQEIHTFTPKHLPQPDNSMYDHNLN